jgi:transketolase/fructose-1,6-bisphosphatase class II
VSSAERLSITTTRMLSIDQVEKANSGHPGLPLGLAPVAHTLFARIMKFDPADPAWPNRDRFVLSAGHGSALLYSLLHLFGYDLPLSELERFRQLGSKTPGHPEYGHTVGVETTTGPLGQGIATAVGMAIAEEHKRAQVRDALGEDLIDHYTFVLASDGDLMEGISHEAASLAGHLGLSRLIVGFDSNDITIDGPAHQSCTDDAMERFRSYGWQVLELSDVENPDEIEAVYRTAMADTSRPSLIVCHTTIGKGAPHKQGTSKVHGSPLGPEELKATKEFYGWPLDPPFYVPQEVRDYLDGIIKAKQDEARQWREKAERIGFKPERFAAPTINPAELGAPSIEVGKTIATRVASNNFLKEVATQLEWVIGGSADLAESTGTKLDDSPFTRDNRAASVIHFGIREHGMAAAANGMALYGYKPYVSTFLVFSDYLRPSYRLSAIMGLGVIYLFSHDSIAVGEDGPTHQPIEQVEALRIIPNSAVIRPADATETYDGWRVALSLNTGPVALILTRQGLPTLEPEPDPSWLKQYGARIVHGKDRNPDVVLLASGSEVSLCIEAAKIMEEENGVVARVVSVPWREKFLSLSQQEQDELSPAGVPRLVVEAGVATGWASFLQPGDRLYNLERFGASAPMKDVLAAYGFTPSAVADAALDLVIDGNRLGKPSHLVSHLLAATEAAAVAAQPLVGLGDKNKADAAAVNAMRQSLATLPVAGKVIVGEGEKDKAPMLYVGEHLGTGTIDIDIAVDPLEGTNYAATGKEGAIAVIACAPGGGFKQLPGYYMEKLVVPEAAAGVLDIERPVADNLKLVAKRMGLSTSEAAVVVLAKPRHMAKIAELRSQGIPVVEIPDGDVMASLRVLVGDPRVVMLWGIGGTPEGVITAAATLALAGQMQARPAPQSKEEEEILANYDPNWKQLRFEALDLAHPDSVVVATSVTGATPLAPPRTVGDATELESLWIESGRFGIVRRLVAQD